MPLFCPAPDGEINIRRSGITVGRSVKVDAARSYMNSRSGRGLNFPLYLYILNEMDARRGMTPRVAFGPTEPSLVINTDIQNSVVIEGDSCSWYHVGESYSKDDFKKITTGRSPTPQYSEDFGLQPTGYERSPFRDPGIRIAMNYKKINGTGVRTGWLKKAQTSAEYNPQNIQNNINNAQQQQQQYADAARQAQQEIGELRERERGLLERQKALNAQAQALQVPGKTQEQFAKETQGMQAELNQIQAELVEVQQEIQKYDAVGQALLSAKNPQLAAGLKVAGKRTTRRMQ
jgi:hypothetical protein